MAGLLAALVGLSVQAHAFTHPSIPTTLEELDTIKASLNQEPWKSGYALLAATSTAQLTWQIEGPYANVSRQGSYDANLGAWQNSMDAVYNLARTWYFTGNAAYAQKARDILITWATTNTTFNGNEAGLAMGDYAHAFAGGASILRGTWPGWTAADTAVVKNYFANVLWPNCQANLNITGPNDLAMVAGIAIAVFCDDTAKFDHVVNLYRTYHGSGLRDTLPTGQHGETGRDLGPPICASPRPPTKTTSTPPLATPPAVNDAPGRTLTLDGVSPVVRPSPVPDIPLYRRPHRTRT